MLYDALHRLHLIDGKRLGGSVYLEVIADEDGFILLVNQLRELLELLVATQSGGQLQRADGLGSPCMADAVATIVELTVVGKEVRFLLCQQPLLVPKYLRRSGSPSPMLSKILAPR